MKFSANLSAQILKTWLTVYAQPIEAASLMTVKWTGYLREVSDVARGKFLSKVIGGQGDARWTWALEQRELGCVQNASIKLQTSDESTFY